MSVLWHGYYFDQRTVDMLEEVERSASFKWRVVQGSYSGKVGASAGTHDGGGAVDIMMDTPDHDALVEVMRRVGFAAWHRTPEQGFDDRHIHGIAVQPGGEGDQGCLASGAHDQVVDYYAGRNGLANNGPDDGPRGYVGVTWETYNNSSEGEDEMTPEQAATLDNIAWMVGQIKPQTDQINPRMVEPLDAIHWGVNDASEGLRTMVADVQERLGHLEATLL